MCFVVHLRWIQFAHTSIRVKMKVYEFIIHNIFDIFKNILYLAGFEINTHTN